MKGKTVPVPFWPRRIGAVWWRHARTYAGNLLSNATPPFIEPLVFLLGIGLGLGQYVLPIDGLPYLQYLAVGLIVTSSMYTAAFECTFGTFIRLEFDKVYDGMIAASLTAEDLLVGEILFSATKGVFFSFSCLVILQLFGLIPSWLTWGAIGLGFLTAAMFACLSLLVTAFVTNINHFNFYFTLFLSPLFFFSGVVFPVDSLPEWARWIAWAVPLTHPVELTRALATGHFAVGHLLNLAYIVVFIGGIGFLAVRLLRRRLVN